MSNYTNIDWESLAKFAKAGSPLSEMAATQGLSLNQFKEACEDKHGMPLEQWARKQKSTGNAELREAQNRLAIEKLNPIMLVFLGKNNLGQSDRPQNTADKARTFVDSIRSARREPIKDTQSYEDQELDDV